MTVVTGYLIRRVLLYRADWDETSIKQLLSCSASGITRTLPGKRIMWSVINEVHCVLPGVNNSQLSSTLSIRLLAIGMCQDLS